MIVEADRATLAADPRLRPARGPGRRRPGGHRSATASRSEFPEDAVREAEALPSEVPARGRSPAGGTSGTGPP
ncbi:MAG: hypothetical protein MZU79_04860 [Anaerotruncus sp.]|nr:hypothetical protein [Anaerotruncus sp.]